MRQCTFYGPDDARSKDLLGECNKGLHCDGKVRYVCGNINDAHSWSDEEQDHLDDRPNDKVDIPHADHP